MGRIVAIAPAGLEPRTVEQACDKGASPAGRIHRSTSPAFELKPKKDKHMRHFHRLRLLGAFLAVIGLAACGFTPVYGTGSQVGEILSDIEVAPPGNRAEYFFVRDLEQRLGRHSDARATLRYNLALSEQGLSLTNTNRAHVNGTVSYQLVSNEDGAVIASGSVNNFTSYSSHRNSYSTQSDDATERLMSILADQVITDLSLRLPLS